MPKIRGYLRVHTKWDGTPGLSLAKQRVLVDQIAFKLNGEGSRYYGRPKCCVESAAGSADGWPVLKSAVERARDGVDIDTVLVIPLLDGVRFKPEFLQLLVGREEAPIYLASGRAGAELQTGRNFWHLGDVDHWRALHEKIAQLRDWRRRLSGAIKAGIEDAAEKGKPTGAARPGAHQFTEAERRRGGQTMARKNRLAAYAPYEGWIPLICECRRQNWSLEQIAIKLADQKASTRDGRKIGPTQIWRILKRLECGDTAAQATR